jgi:serine/threonine protein kinase
VSPTSKAETPANTGHPRAIGPYRITGQLGQGGMGVVYAGLHSQHGGSAAIKTVDRVDPLKFLLIRQEIHTLSRLRHPGVVRIFEQGTVDGQPWFAMERLEGLTLQEMCNAPQRAGGALESTVAVSQQTGTPVDWRAVESRQASLVGPAPRNSQPPPQHAPLPSLLGIMQRVAETLAYVHGEGIVHRDVKPSNIFIRRSGHPILVDFGLVAEARGSVGREVVDASCQLAGSPLYMSPEQLRGEVLDARADLYAFGCVFYHLITGRTPFQGSRNDVIRSHLEAQAPPPSSIVGGIPSELDELVLALLAKDRDMRLGFAEIVVHRLAGMAVLPPVWESDPPDHQPYLYRSSFVGRGDMLHRLGKHLEDVRTGSGNLVLVVGESGAGKTRLALEATAIAGKKGIAVVSGEGLPTLEPGGEGHQRLGRPLHHLRKLFECIVDRCIAWGEQAQQELIGGRSPVLASYFPELLSLPGMDTLAPPPSLPTKAARERLFRCIAGTLGTFASQRPLLLVLDDLQWADELTLAFVRWLGEDAIRQMPVLLLCTYRLEEETEELESLTRLPNASLLRLARMAGSEVGMIAAGMLALPSPPLGFVNFLERRSNGNPFFIAEYLRVAVTARVLHLDKSGRWVLAEADSLDVAYDSLPLPHSLRQLIELRLDRLKPRARRVLDTAALMGLRLHLPGLQLSEGLDEEAMLEIIGEWLRRQIVEQDDDGFRFLHDKIREVAELQMHADDRVSRHGDIAAALEQTSGDPNQSHAMIGRHWSLARQPAKAVPHLRDAAEYAQKVYAITDAIDLFRDAARPAEAEEAGLWALERASLNEALGDALALQGCHAEARQTFGEAAIHTNAPLSVGRLHRKTGKTYEIEHAHQNALSSYAKASLQLERCKQTEPGWRHEWIQIKLDKVWIHYWLRQIDEIDTELTAVEPFVLAEGLPSHRYHYYLSKVNRDNRHNRYRVSAETLEDVEALVAAAQESGSAPEIAFGQFCKGFCLLFANRLAQAQAELAKARQICRQIGDVVGETRAAAYLTLSLRRRGQLDEAERSATELESLAVARKMADYHGVALATLGWAAAKHGGPEQARRLGRQALLTWSQLDFPHPFQWAAALLLIELDLTQAPLAELLALAELLRRPTQMHLPEAVDLALAEAVGLPLEDGPARSALRQAVRASKKAGLL